jgi:hypothetical protein
MVSFWKVLHLFFLLQFNIGLIIKNVKNLSWTWKYFSQWLLDISRKKKRETQWLKQTSQFLRYWNNQNRDSSNFIKTLYPTSKSLSFQNKRYYGNHFSQNWLTFSRMHFYLLWLLPSYRLIGGFTCKTCCPTIRHRSGS